MSAASSLVSPKALDQWRAMTAPEGQLHRALLRAARSGALLQDQIDCAELALAGGQRDIARMLFGLVFLQIGFSPEGLALQGEVEARSGLWAGPVRSEANLPDPPASRFSVEIAIAELRRLMRAVPRPRRLERLDTIQPLSEEAFPPKPESDELRARVVDLLQAVPRIEADGRLAQALGGLADELCTFGPIRLEEHLDEDASGLSTLFAVRETQPFALLAREFLEAEPTGALFREAGRLNPAGLGPYFSNVHQIIRNAQDILALIGAASEGQASKEEIDCWCVLLCTGLPDPETAELVVELGDRGMTRALRLLLSQTGRWTAIEKRQEVAESIRDAGLDLGDLALAAAAQHLIASCSPNDKIAWGVLGDIRATLGDAAGAEMAFSHWLHLDPGDDGAIERLRALRSGGFGPFQVTGGYKSSPIRRHLRRRHRV